MATTTTTTTQTRRPKLSLQINAIKPVQSMASPITLLLAQPQLPQPQQQHHTFTKPTGALSLPIPSSAHPARRPIRFSYGPTASDSEMETDDDGKFWSGEEASSATSSSSDDDDLPSLGGKQVGPAGNINFHNHNNSIHNNNNSNTVVLPSPSYLTSPFLPPPTGMRFPAAPQKPGMKKLRLLTAIPPASNSNTFLAQTPVMTAPQSSSSSSSSKQKLSLSIPTLATAPPKRLTLVTSSSIPLPPSSSSYSYSSTALALERKPTVTRSGKPRKSVSFSTEADSVITTTNYTLSNADLLSYISSEECSAEELSEKWGMTVEEGRMLGMPRSKVDRRERKWIGLTNSFLRDGCKKIVDSDEES